MGLCPGHSKGNLTGARGLGGGGGGDARYRNSSKLSSRRIVEIGHRLLSLPSFATSEQL